MKPRPPEFITFTGADDRTDVAAMGALSKVFPVEWGVLFSPSSQGVKNRYPGGNALSRFAWSGLRMSAHLCGEHSRNVMAGRPVKAGIDFGSCFGRMQINSGTPDATMIRTFAREWGVKRGIAQTRGEFPRDTSIDWLFDASGGRGQLPASWPKYPGRLVGYAGGMNPSNIAAVIATINADGPYWIDMETGVRTDDWFDIDLCRSVCETVYLSESPSSATPKTTQEQTKI